VNEGQSIKHLQTVRVATNPLPLPFTLCTEKVISLRLIVPHGPPQSDVGPCWSSTGGGGIGAVTGQYTDNETKYKPQ
jgi:hypothetical protein